ncbi:hypothetical protein, partial [Pararhizobium antarcticum]|uniref:hypothetical protein n=1 Tax=Pararhizobium antarcticum TaxID=1798805 RepID=UPI001AECF039
IGKAAEKQCRARAQQKSLQFHNLPPRRVMSICVARGQLLIKHSTESIDIPCCTAEKGFDTLLAVSEGRERYQPDTKMPAWAAGIQCWLGCVRRRKDQVFGLRFCGS